MTQIDDLLWALVHVTHTGTIAAAKGAPRDLVASLVGTSIAQLLPQELYGSALTQESTVWATGVTQFDVQAMETDTLTTVSLRRRTTDLEQLLVEASASRVARGMAHDFNNVLHLVLSGVRCLRQAPERADDWLRAIRSAVARGSGLIDGVRPFIRSDAPPVSMSADTLAIHLTTGLRLIVHDTIVKAQVDAPALQLTLRPAVLFTVLGAMLLELERRGARQTTLHVAQTIGTQQTSATFALRTDPETSIALAPEFHQLAETLGTLELEGCPAITVGADAPDDDDIDLGDALCLVVTKAARPFDAMLEGQGAALLHATAAETRSMVADYLDELDVVVVSLDEATEAWALMLSTALLTRAQLPVIVLSDAPALVGLGAHHPNTVRLPAGTKDSVLLRQVRDSIGRARVRNAR